MDKSETRTFTVTASSPELMRRLERFLALLHFNREQMAAWIGGPAYRQTLEDIAELALPLVRRSA